MRRVALSELLSWAKLHAPRLARLYPHLERAANYKLKANLISQISRAYNKAHRAEAAARAALNPLYDKHRPKRLSGVVGQARTVQAVKALLRGDGPDAWLIVGESGQGKTTIAEAVARELAKDPLDVEEVNAGAIRGIDYIRALPEKLRYYPRGHSRGGWRVMIFNEAHNLTHEAQEAFLDILEKLPPRRLLIFTSTRLDRFSGAFKSRCKIFVLRAFKRGVVLKHLAKVARAEGKVVQPRILNKIAEISGGNLRSALQLLEEHLATGRAPSPPPPAAEEMAPGGLPMRPKARAKRQARSSGAPPVRFRGAKGRRLYIEVRGKAYAYGPKRGDKRGLGQLVRSFTGILKYSPWKALNWLKKNARRLRMATDPRPGKLSDLRGVVLTLRSKKSGAWFLYSPKHDQAVKVQPALMRRVLALARARGLIAGRKNPWIDRDDLANVEGVLRGSGYELSEILRYPVREGHPGQVSMFSGRGGSASRDKPWWLALLEASAPEREQEENPRLTSSQERAARLVERFTERAPRRAWPVNFRRPRALAYLGEARRIYYISNKWGHKDRLYYHDLGRGAKLYADERGKDQLFIFRKGLRVQARGIVG